MKLRDFTLTTNELPPTNVYVLGYWEGEPAPFNVVRADADGIWWASDPDISDDYIAPTSWSHLPGGIDLNRGQPPRARNGPRGELWQASQRLRLGSLAHPCFVHGKFEIDLDAEV